MGLYLTALFGFCFITHPVRYCLLLVGASALVGGFLFMFSGAGWYVLIFFLVYVGGVYILFIFVSVHIPNIRLKFRFVPMFLFCSFFALSSFFVFLVEFEVGFVESSHYLCSLVEGVSYTFFCVILMLGLGVIGLVLGSGGQFSR